ncbi:MAG TPA: ABC transporter substrate-binding protein [Rubrivivax sp.]
MQTDYYSITVSAHIFESLFTYDLLASPLQIVPLTAAGLAEPSDGFRTWTIRLRPGIRFHDHPAFGGRVRELTAEDYVFSFKRVADPQVRSALTWLEEAAPLGLAELVKRARDSGRPLDYDRPVPGLRALDRYTLQIRTEEPRPHLPLRLATEDTGALAREIVQQYGLSVSEHPVGTGPFRLSHWRRGSRIVLERNPHYRERFYAASPTAGDVEGQRIAARLAGRRLPMVDRVEIAVIPEEQPRWLEFLGGRLDQLLVPGSFVAQAAPGGKVAPYLGRRGVRVWQGLTPSVRLMWFNMEHPLVGGYAPAQVALRRAIGLGMNCDRDIHLVYGGQSRIAHTVFAPHQSGFDATQRSEMGLYDPARAKALLDLYGWLDRDGDGWRERPEGSPLVLERSTQTDQRARRLDEFFVRDMRAIGLRVVLRPGSFQENAKAGRAGKLMMWALGFGASVPDGHSYLTRYYGKSRTFARFRLPAMDRLYERIALLPDGEERLVLMRQAERLAIAYMPYKFTSQEVETHLTQARLVGFRQPAFRNDWFHLVDIE